MRREKRNRHFMKVVTIKKAIIKKQPRLYFLVKQVFRIIFILEVFYLEVDFSFIRKSIAGYVTEDKWKRYDKENAYNMKIMYLNI